MDNDPKSQIKELNNLEPFQFLAYFKKLNLEKQEKLISNPFLSELKEANFRILFFNIDYVSATRILENERLYDKVLNLNSNGKRTILNVLETNKTSLLKLILESPYAFNYLFQIKAYFEEIDVNRFRDLISFIDIEKLTKKLVNYENKNQLYNFINSKFKLKNDNNFNDIFSNLFNKLQTKKINPGYLFKINNYKELILYVKFNVLVKTFDDSNDIVLNNGLVLPNEIINIKENKIIKLIELLKTKGDATDEDLLEVSLKLYYIFGFDNAKKIIQDKFTNMNVSAITRVADFKYKDERREYRTKNQNKFYYYGMVDVVLDSLENGSNNIFELLTYNENKTEAELILKEFKKLESDYSNSELRKQIKEKLKEKIYLREQQYKNNIYEETYNKYKENNLKKIDTLRLKELLKDVDLKKVATTYDDNILKKLNEFLLGNTKNNNDCLFRLIVNEEALGLNDNLFQLINNFKLIESIASKGNLSLNSVLDVIDILKIDLYHLRPNEQDIFLSTLTKIINSTEFCTENNINIIREICKLHIKRKEKTYASIPTVRGGLDSYTYEVAPFDAEYLLSAGCDSKNCFKISGKGEEFFRYCLTSEQAAIIYIRGKKNTYICPLIRSGNMINVNNISPDIDSSEEIYVVEALKKCLIDIMEKAYIHKEHTKNIEVATLTNWHLQKFFSHNKYEKINLDRNIPLDKDCYNDYNKSDITNYILVKSDKFISPSYYLSSDKFYQDRKPNYEFDINSEYDKERLSLIVNSIYYSSIDYKKISESKKDKERRECEKLDVLRFRYIIGNKDWYVAIDDQFNILANLLPYDERAKSDYFNALTRVSNIIDKIMEESYDREDNRKSR